MTTQTPAAPAAPAELKAPTMYAVRAQHDGVSHFLVREAANVQTVGPNGYMVNTPEVLSLGVHSATTRAQTGPGSWEPSDPTLTPPDALEVLRFTSEARAQEVADRANQNPAGYVWYVVEHPWTPPAGYVPPANSEAADMLEARNAALRIQLAQLQQRQLEAQIAEAERAAAPVDAPVPAEDLASKVAASEAPVPAEDLASKVAASEAPAAPFNPLA